MDRVELLEAKVAERQNELDLLSGQLGEMRRQVDEKLKLLNVVQQRLTDPERAAYEAQIALIKEDFARERRDRERLRTRVLSLRTKLSSSRKRTVALQRELSSVRNNRRKFGALPPRKVPLKRA